MNGFAEGISISLLGIGITFAALGTLILLIVLLKWLFPAKREAASELGASDRMEHEAESERVVAIAAAWHYLQSSRGQDGKLGDRLLEPHGPWWYKTEDKD